jgi:hypothetical protein
VDLLPLSQVLPEVNAPIAGLRGLGKTLRMAQVETILAFCCFALEFLFAEGTGAKQWGVFACREGRRRAGWGVGRADRWSGSSLRTVGR